MKNRFVFFCISSFCMGFAVHTGSLFAQETSRNQTMVPQQDLLRQGPLKDKTSEYNECLQKGHKKEEDGQYAEAADLYSAARELSLRESNGKANQREVVGAWFFEIEMRLKAQDPEGMEKALKGLESYLKRIPEYDANKAPLRDNICHPDKFLFFKGRLSLLKREKETSLKLFEEFVERYPIDSEKELTIWGVDVVKIHYYYGLALEINGDFQRAAERFKLVRETKAQKKALSFQAWEHETFCRIRGGGDLLDGIDDLFGKFNGQDESPKFTAKSKSRSNELLKVYCYLRKAPLNDPLPDGDANTIADILKEDSDLSPMQLIVLCDIANILLKGGKADLSANIYKVAYGKSSPTGKFYILAPWLEALRQSYKKSNDEEFAQDAQKLVKKHVQDFKREGVSLEAKAIAAQILLQIPDYKSAGDLYSQIFHAKPADHKILQNGLITLAKGKNEGKDRAQELINLYYTDGLESPEAKEDMGFYYSESGSKVEAAKQYEAAGDAYYKEGKGGKGLSAYLESARLLFELKDLDSYVKITKKILPEGKIKDVSSCEVLYKRGELYKLKGDWKKAHGDWERLQEFSEIEKDLECRVLIANGMLYFEEGEYKNAFKNLEKVIRDRLIKDASTREIVFFGMVLSATRLEEKESVDHCCTYLDSDFQESKTEFIGKARLELALYCFEKKKYEDAEKIIDKTLEMGKNDGKTDFVKAIECKLEIIKKRNKSNGYEDAISFLGKNESIFNGMPNAYRIYYLWGNLLKEHGDYRGAIEKYGEIEKLKPVHEDEIIQASIGAWGDCQFALGEYKDARNKYEKLIKLKELHKPFELMTLYKRTRCKQLEDNTNDWQNIVSEYVDIITKRNADELKKQPADIFWVMKAFGEIRSLFELHRGNVSLNEHYGEIEEKIKELGKNGICNEYLKKIRNDCKKYVSYEEDQQKSKGVNND